MPSKVSMSGAGHDREPTVEELKRELAEAHRRETASKLDLQESREYQTAISDVLGVISRSPTNVQPVFDTIAQAAGQLCKAQFCHVFRFDGQLIHFAASHGQPLENIENTRRVYPIPPGGVSAAARSILTGVVEVIPDIYADPEYQHGHTANFRSIVAVPMLKDSAPVGAICLARSETGHFPQRQIELLRTFADQAVIAIENTRLFEAEQTRSRELTEALEQQTATADVLKVISRSAFNLQTVLAELIRSAVPLCEADFGHIRQRVGELYPVAASFGLTQEQHALFASSAGGTASVTRGSIPGRALIERRIVHFPDVLNDPEFTFHDLAKSVGFRAAVGVPLISNGQIVGVMTLNRATPGAFSEKQLALLETFADQAVIAIENTRLFEAEQASKRELEESLKYQTATSEVLAAISRTPTELQPVLAEICNTANILCETPDAAIFFRDGHWLRIASVQGTIGGDVDKIALSRGFVAGRTFLDREVVHVHDLRAAADEYPEGYDSSLRLGHRTIIGVPLIRNENAIGVLILRRSEVKPFTDKQIQVLKTFADQAVIAIENTRLFEAEQASKRELQESLEYQTAISDVLNVISRSPNELQPVLDVIVKTAVRLCRSSYGHVRLLRDDGAYHIASHQISDRDLLAQMLENPFRPGVDSVSGRAALQGVPVHVADVAADPLVSGFQRKISDKVRTALAVPLKRNGAVVGLISVFHGEVRPFTQQQIDLVTTFANQAIIAMNNVRLFEAEQARTRELTEALEQQTATADVLKVISRSALDLQRVLDALVESAARLCNANDAAIFQVLGDRLRLVAHHGQIPTARPVGQHTPPLVRGRMGSRAVIERRTIQVADMLAEADEYPESRKVALELGWRTALAVPLLHAGKAIGVIFLRRAEVRPFTERQIELVNTFSDQAVIAIENTRLFNEIAQKSRELEIASQHKSQFVANMSHELRTPLAAILGYAELMQEGFYEPLGQKSLDALTRIRSNGKHLLGLINTVLDIAKIESGQFTLNMAEYAIESVVETVRSATESLAQNKKLTLKTEVGKSLPIGLGDEQRLTQVLLNLVGNAIKFTDTGEVRVTAKAVNGHFNVSVADTGPGIPEEHQSRIFDQFHQVDSSNTKAKGGTGLGLAIAKQIVEMHGGRIWVESTLGKGSTFQMELPTRAEFHKRAP